jgi:hypothetical protein
MRCLNLKRHGVKLLRFTTVLAFNERLSNGVNGCTSFLVAANKVTYGFAVVGVIPRSNLRLYPIALLPSVPE